MTVATKFIERRTIDIRRNDELLISATLGDRIDLMYRSWVDSGGTAHLFWVYSRLYARGNKQEREFAKGFVSAWCAAMRVEAYDE